MYRVRFGHNVQEQRRGDWWYINTNETYDEKVDVDTLEEVYSMYDLFMEIEYNVLYRRACYADSRMTGVKKYGKKESFKTFLKTIIKGKQHKVYFDVSKHTKE